MLSTCPSCLNQILHEDSQSSVICDCGENFSPFLNVPPLMDININSPLMAMAEKGPTLDAPSPSLENPLEFAESEAAFAELRNFGETLLSEGKETPDYSSLQPPEEKEQVEKPSTEPFAPVAQTDSQPSWVPSTTSQSSCVITAGDQLSGYVLEAFLPPISIWCPAQAESEDPLKSAHDMLAKRAEQIGANGVVSVRWSFTPDGARILLTGTPVKCRKSS